MPAQYGLPALDGNLCEGVVIRPVQSAFLHNGSRIILKNKNEKWAENNNLIDTQLLRALFKQDVGENETVRILCEEVYKLITENRLNNLLSKIGKVDMKKDLGKIVGMYCKDALDDLKKEFGTTYNSLAKNEQKFVNKFLNTHASKLIAKSTDHFTP
ncbi:MAG: hypothetical protein JKX84_11450 [Flavobacteriales bacterium]|nr:hypothetical protein [Flavobacteriales bacterium]